MAYHRAFAFDIVLNNLVACAIKNRFGSCSKSDGTPWRPIVHIEDISSSLHRCIAC